MDSTKTQSSNKFLIRNPQWQLRDFVQACRGVAWICVLGTIFIALQILALESSSPIEKRLSVTTLSSNEVRAVSDPNIAAKLFQSSHSSEKSSVTDFKEIWIQTQPFVCKDGCVIQLPNLRAESYIGWLERNEHFEKVKPERNADGFFFKIPVGNDAVKLLVKMRPESMHQITAVQLPIPPHTSRLTSKNDKSGGLIYGALISLAVFSFLVSILNKDISFLLLSAWLLTTCRLAAFNGPWDFYWIGLHLQQETHILFSKFALAFHSILSTALFVLILREHMGEKQTLVVTVICYLVALTLPAALIMSTAVYMQFFWAITCMTLSVSIGIAAYIALKSKLFHIGLFSVAWASIIIGAMSDIAFAAGYIPNKFTFVNVQVGAIASGLIMSIAIADKMRRERNSRLATQNSLLSVFKKFKSLYTNVPVGLGTFNEKLELLAHNELFSRTLGLSGKETIKGKNLRHLFPEAVELFKQANEQTGSENFECKLNVDGRIVWLRVNTRKVGATIDCSFEDITARKLSEEKLEFLARHDPLTGFKNRHEFDKTLQAILDDKPKLARTSIAHVDIKGFKLFNELFGHALGDEMLTQFAGRIESANKRGHQVFRLDGDDFYIIFENMDGPTVEFECSIIQDALSRRHYVVNQRAMALEVGIGIVHLNDGISANDVLASASDASDRAKRSSETKVIAVSRDSEALKEQIQERHLMASMKQRFPEERLFLNAQPIISLADPNGSLAYEVLVRLKGENGGIISPGQFIPAAEKNGLMSMVDRWVLNETLVWLELNKEHAKRVDFITVNLSGASLNDLRFAEDALSIVKEHRQLASKICFEVTESVALFDLKATLRFVEQTKSFGCRLALDDFGAGYTSFKYLKDIPSDILKIDGSYVRGINKSVANHAIVKAITDLTHEMGMKCVAEWIEDIPTIRTLQRLGMDYGQGFGMSRPMSMDDITVATSGFDAMTEPNAIDFYSKLLHLPHRRMAQATLVETI